MKSLRYTLFFLPLLLMNFSGRAQSYSQELTSWSFCYRNTWLPATVPGCIHTDLLAHHLIPDPFLATNEDSVQWVSDSVWTYTTTFSVAPSALSRQKYIALVFDGLETYAEVSLNGKVVAHTNNMFRQWRIPSTASQLKSSNRLSVRFFPTRPYDDSCARSLPYQVPEQRSFTRTAPYQQGWDWGPKLNTCGIWQSVRLEVGNTDNTTADKSFRNFPYRNVSLRQQPDSIGASFCFDANGEPLFIKGAHWIPVHSFPICDSAQRERYRNLLCAAKESNFNMLRVWGGGIYEPDYFYDLCDSLGLMVWQDFMYAGTFYPADTAFLRNAQEEAEQQVRRLARHPCVVLWCGNNEVKNGWEDWGWQQQFGYTPEQQVGIAAGIDTLFGLGGILDRAVARYAPGTPYISTSPLYGWGHPECVTHGDSQYWGVWWGEQPFEMYRQKTGRFMSEYGFQSYPSMATISAFCGDSLPTGASDALDTPTMRHHQKHTRGVQIIDQALLRYYGTTSQRLTLAHYVYLSQLAQAHGTGMAIEAHRMRMGHCWGTLYWQINDCWPVASWSSIDYYGNWKALQYKARELYAPTIIATEPLAPRQVQIHIVTDSVAPTGRLLGEVCSFAGTVLDTFAVQVASLHNESRLMARYTLPSAIDTSSCYLRLRYFDDYQNIQAQKVHYFVAPRNLALTSRDTVSTLVSKKGNAYQITLFSPCLAKDVMLTTSSNMAGHFTDNYFDLLPNEAKTVVFLPDTTDEPLQGVQVVDYNHISK